MKLKEITVGVERLIALPNYENVKYRVSMTAECSVEDDPEAVYNFLKVTCQNKIIEEYNRLNAGQATATKK